MSTSFEKTFARILDPNSPPFPVQEEMTTPTLLSQCGSKVVIDTKDKYCLAIEPGEYLIITVGFDHNKPGAKFTHPNIAASRKTINEYKHYRSNGSKFWTSHAGIDHVLVIPRSSVTLLPIKGYSYIKAEINGVKVSFNVSGGGGDGWTDYLDNCVHISCNHKLGDFKKLCEVAVRNSPYEPIQWKDEPEDERKRTEERWEHISGNSNPNLKKQIGKMVDEGKKPVLCFRNGYSWSGMKKAEGVETVRHATRVVLEKNEDGSPKRWEYDYTTGKLRGFILSDGHYKCHAKLSHIDFYETAKENKLTA
jgi:hypothetical protein